MINFDCLLKFLLFFINKVSFACSSICLNDSILLFQKPMLFHTILNRIISVRILQIFGYFYCVFAGNSFVFKLSLNTCKIFFINDFFVTRCRWRFKINLVFTGYLEGRFIFYLMTAI